MVILVLMCILMPPGTRFERYGFGDYGGWSVFPYFIESCIAAYVYMCISRLISMVPALCRTLSLVGRHTLGIICLHLFVIKMLIAPFIDLTRVAALPKLSTTEGVLVGTLTLSIITLATEYLPTMIRKIGGKKDRGTAVGPWSYRDRT